MGAGAANDRHRRGQALMPRKHIEAYGTTLKLKAILMSASIPEVELDTMALLEHETRKRLAEWREAKRKETQNENKDTS